MGSSEDLRPPRGFVRPRDTGGVSVHSYLTLKVICSILDIDMDRVCRLHFAMSGGQNRVMKSVTLSPLNVDLHNTGIG